MQATRGAINTQAQRIRISALAIKHRNLLRVLAVPPDGNLWSVTRSLLGPKPRPITVTVTQLRDSFETRMNPPQALPPEFNPLRHALNRLTAQSLPRQTLDTTKEGFFSRPFSTDEIEVVKTHIRRHCKGSATGPDGLDVDYSAVLSVSFNVLRTLFQRCIDEGTAPQAWLTAIIAAVKKPNKDAADPASYRTIGLESCFLKTLPFSSIAGSGTGQNQRVASRTPRAGCGRATGRQTTPSCYVR